MVMQDEIITQLEEVRELCGRIAADMKRPEQQGRMASMGESRNMDELSIALRRRLAELPQNLMEHLSSPELRQQAGALIREVQLSLRTVLQPEMRASGSAAPMPKASPGRLKAYAAY